MSRSRNVVCPVCDHQDVLVGYLLHHNVSLLNDDVMPGTHVRSEVAPAGVSGGADGALVGTFRLGQVGSEMILGGSRGLDTVGVE